MASRHIAIACTMHPPGDVRMFTRWTVGLAARGWRVSLIAPRRGPVPEMPAGVEYIETPFVQGHLSRYRKASRVLKPLGDLDPDVVLFPDPELIPVMLPYRHKHKAIAVFDRHENFDRPDEQFSYNFLSSAAAFAYVLYEDWALPHLDGVVVVLEGMLRRLNRRTKSIVAHNFPTGATYARLAQGPRPGTKAYTCVNIGSQQLIRGLREWLETVRILVKERGRSDFTILLGGRFDPGAYDVARDFVAAHDLQDAVTLAPQPFSHAESLNQVCAARIGFSPLLNNAMAKLELQNKLLEFMGASLPVITSPSSMDGEIVRAAHCGVLHWADKVNELADALERYMDNPDEARRLGQAGREYATSHLCWDRELDAIEEWFEKLIAAKRRG